LGHRDILGAALFVLLGAGVVWGAAQLPFGTMRLPGAGAVPLAIGVALMVLGVALALRPHATPAEATEEPPEPWGQTRVVAVCVLIAIYVFILPAAGFLAATTLLMIALYAIGDSRGFGLRPIIAGAITAAAAYGLFVWLLDVPLPGGWIWGN
jgi:hypothetical protein